MGGPVKGRADYYAPGDWNIACSMCGRKRKASTVVRNWQGLWRCPEHNEPRQTQDFVRDVKDNISVPFLLDETDSFVTDFCTLDEVSAVPGSAVPGCSLPGFIFPGQFIPIIVPPIPPVNDHSAIPSIAIAGLMWPSVLN